MALKPPFSKVYISLPVRLVGICLVSYLLSYLGTNYLFNRFAIQIPEIINNIHPQIIYNLPAIIVTAIIVSVFTYFGFDRPLTKLEETIKKAENGNFLVRAPVVNRYELGRLAFRFNRMLAHITTLAARQAQAEHELVVAQEELKYRNQISEHKKQLEEANNHLENAVKDLSLLYEIGQEISTVADSTIFYSKLTRTLQKYLKLSQLAILTYDDSKEYLEVKALIGFPNQSKIMNAVFKKGEGISGRAVATGQRVYVKNTTTDKRYLHGKVEPLPYTTSLVSVPLSYKGDILGVINYFRKGEDQFSQAEIRLMTLVSNQVALTIANSRLYTKTRQLSVTDELTGLYNRRHLQQSLQVEWKRAVRFKRSLSLLMIDIDNFKKYNDSHGHLEGDSALKQVSKIMQKNLREVDLVARFGGEEFVALLPDTDKHGAIVVAEKIRRLVDELQLKTKENVKVTISVGIANYPEDVNTVEELIDNADIALYQAKEKGKNLVVCFNCDMELSKEKQPKSEELENEEEQASEEYVQ